MICHRDIKPENLLVIDRQTTKVVTSQIAREQMMIKCPVQSLKLADFGLAVAVREPLFTVCGTPTYVAPEILAETGYGVKVSPGMHFLENQNYFLSYFGMAWLMLMQSV